MFIPNWAYIQERGGAIFEMLIGLHIWGTYISGGGGGGWGGLLMGAILIIPTGYIH